MRRRRRENTPAPHMHHKKKEAEWAAFGTRCTEASITSYTLHTSTSSYFAASPKPDAISPARLERSEKKPPNAQPGIIFNLHFAQKKQPCWDSTRPPATLSPSRALQKAGEPDRHENRNELSEVSQAWRLWQNKGQGQCHT